MLYPSLTTKDFVKRAATYLGNSISYKQCASLVSHIATMGNLSHLIRRWAHWSKTVSTILPSIFALYLVLAKLVTSILQQAAAKQHRIHPQERRLKAGEGDLRTVASFWFVHITLFYHGYVAEGQSGGKQERIVLLATISHRFQITLKHIISAGGNCPSS